MASLVQSGMYGAINTADNTSYWLYVIQFISEAYKLQKNTTIYGQGISDSELVFKAQYICSMQENMNWYCKQQPLQHTIIVSTRTILHTRLDFIIIRHVQDITKNICIKNQEKKQYKDIQIL